MEIVGILLAGGSGKRMRPLSDVVNKQLLPVYNKPMIFYSLSVLMLSKIRNIIIVTDKHYLKFYKKLLGDGSKFGIKLRYVIQSKPNGIPECFIISKKLIKNKKVCLLLGDNFFFGQGMVEAMNQGIKENKGAYFYAYNVKNPSDYAVLNFKKNRILDIKEKPKKPKTNFAIPGLYFFDENVSKFTKQLKKSKRGEYEIVDLINIYQNINKANFHLLRRGISWLDMGSFDDLISCGNFIKAIEDRQNLMIGSPEEIAWRNKWIKTKDLIKISENYKNYYGEYLRNICQ